MEVVAGIKWNLKFSLRGSGHMMAGFPRVLLLMLGMLISSKAPLGIGAAASHGPGDPADFCLFLLCNVWCVHKQFLALLCRSVQL